MSVRSIALGCLFMVLAAVSLDSSACSCAGRARWDGEPEPSAEHEAMELIRGFDLVFTGTVTGIETSQLDRRPAKLRGFGVAVFEIDTLWKGAVPREFRMPFQGSGPACGRSFTPGDRVTVVAYKRSRHDARSWGYGTDSCAHAAFERDEATVRRLLLEYEDRSRELRQVLDARPGDVTTWRAYADLQAQWSDHARMAETYGRILELVPEDRDAAARRAGSLLKLGENEQAAAGAKAVLQTDPGNISARKVVFQLWMREGRRESVDALLRDFSGVDIRNGRFDELTLEGADFRAAHLDRANFGGTRLDGAIFDEVIAESCLFDRASLRRASFARFRARGHVTFRTADLKGASFPGANLAFADFSDALIAGADFSTARISSTRFTGARYSTATRWPKGFDPRRAGAVKEGS